MAGSDPDPAAALPIRLRATARRPRRMPCPMAGRAAGCGGREAIADRRSRGGPPPLKDTMQDDTNRASPRLHDISPSDAAPGAAVPIQAPLAPAAPRGMSRDELRRIVLEIIG